MKSDRLVTLLLLLQSAPMRRARELAKALEVSERTIYRDVDALGAAGIPVYALRGAEGGIALSEGYRRALMHFGQDEVRALFLPGSAILSDLGLGASAETAYDKLRGGLSALQQRAIERTRERVVIDQRRWNQDGVPVEILASLRRAVWDDRCVEIAYRDRTRTRTFRRIDPLGLVSKAGVWYVVANTAEGTRSFRVDRIESAVETAQHFERPDGFDLDSYWRETSAAFMRPDDQSIDVQVRVPRERTGTLDGFFPFRALDDHDPQHIVITFPSLRAAKHWLVAWGTAVTIVSPASIAAELAAHARDVAAHHERSVTA